ncbi:TPA: helix-turn-helix transcriptional regulator [Staphylococcus pseudintermedius]|uniref:Helix-turn-helix transcriptional regulator n=2 Tax=Staphylococcus TaxID=1279 RepID=A0ABS0QPR3_9STAP|nr:MULTISPECIES: helix-turn-helix transcriptional regulator [Staphylococcus]EGQ3102779.1 helix-turn-helix transcriptional regulator [Staphylococcus pseudintermedius]EGQ3526177.1 helix-turn-helix transcriptional regulator [Staphylococcus pseudintermedius]EGQ3896146.1 helix-turn-helix transcriptional regulator [Staphylococcus pseudintermedius]EIU0287505.1 helix-turn-helix transcriptional regulator [Staphylococcus pseudintermedius]ELX9390673.1 helix-turn-helix transcriptional regulator [Staphyloc
MKKSNIDKKKVGQRIKQIRKNVGLNLEEFGEIFSVSKSNVSKWENGANLPNNKRLKTIAELGNISVETLLFGNFDEYIRDLLEKEILNYIYKNELNPSKEFPVFFEQLSWLINTPNRLGKDFFDEKVFINKVNYFLDIEYSLGDRSLDALTRYAYDKLTDADEVIVNIYDDEQGRKQINTDEKIRYFVNELHKLNSQTFKFIDEYREMNNLNRLDSE